MTSKQNFVWTQKVADKKTAQALLYFTGITLCALASVTAQVAVAEESIDASGNYQSETRACQSGRTQQDRATCMKEARNALADKSRGRMNEADSDWASNATARCTPLDGQEAAACRARVMGLGRASGSVSGGGMLREVETVIAPGAGVAFEIDAKTPNPVVLMPMK